jgi:hypothetical protein
MYSPLLVLQTVSLVGTVGGLREQQTDQIRKWFHKWKNNIKTDLIKLDFDSAYYTELVQDRAEM